MTPRRRWSLISLGAIATGIAAFLTPDSDKVVEIAAPVERAQATPAAARPAALTAQLPVRESMGRSRGELFGTRSWAPPKPPPPQPQPEAAPAPPPNLYRFAGTLQHDGNRKIFLALGDRLFEAKEGEMLEQSFRVQSVTADTVTLVYVPLDTPVTMALVFPATPAPAAAGASAPPAPKAPAAKQ